MGDSIVDNANGFCSGLDKFEKEFHLLMRTRMRRLVTIAMDRLLARTPVNTGRAAMNYVATVGAPYSGPEKQAGEAVEPTNQLALGQEQLRPGAEAVSRATLTAVNFNDPYTTFWITNKAEDIEGLELGLLPSAPYTPRSPAGMFGVTVQELLNLLASGKI